MGDGRNETKPKCFPGIKHDVNLSSFKFFGLHYLHAVTHIIGY